MIKKNKNIFFLGAGFSKEFFGLPLNNELLSKLIKKIEEYLSFNDEVNKYEYDKYFEKNNQNYNDLNSIKKQYKKVLYFSLFISIFLLFQNTFDNNKEDNYEIKKIIEEINTKWMTYKSKSTLSLNLKQFLYDELNNLDEENIDILSFVEREINNFVKSNEKIIKEIINILKDKLFSISQIFSKIEFIEQEMLNIKNVATYIEKNEICQMSKICIYYYIKDILNISKQMTNETKKTLDDFIENSKDSLIIDFNWDNKFQKYLDNNGKSKNLKICKIHNSVDNFNIIVSTPLRSCKKNEMYELDKYITDFLEINNEQNLNIYFIGISLTYYDEIFLYKLHELSFVKEQEVNYIYFCYKNDPDHEKKCQKHNKEFKFLNFDIECYKEFKDINLIIKKNNKYND